MKNLIFSHRKLILAATIFGVLLMASFMILFSTQPTSTQKPDEDCYVSPGQTAVRWKSMYWYPCKLSWNGICLWPIRRRHITYKVILTDEVPLRDGNGRAIAVAKGEKRDWLVYDSAAWDALGDNPVERARYPDYEPIAENEFVVAVETRYQWFNDVEATLRICIQQP